MARKRKRGGGKQKPKQEGRSVVYSVIAILGGVAVAVALGPSVMPRVVEFVTQTLIPVMKNTVRQDTKKPQSSFKVEVIPEEQKAYRNLVDWLQYGGAEFPSLTMSDYADEARGMVSTKSIKKGEVFISIPESHLMTEYDALQCDLFLKLQEKEVTDFKFSYTLLSLYLLQELHKDESYWDPYLDILPKTIPSLPLFWSNEDLEHLKGTSLEQRVKTVSQGLKKEYDYIVFYYPEFSEYPFEEFLWAQSIVSSRSFRFLMDGEVVTALVPLVDMLNHNEPAEAHYEYDEGEESFVMTSRVNVRRGDEVHDYYGAKGNARLLMHYGFIIEDNPSDEYNIEFMVPEWLEPVWGRKNFAFSLKIPYDLPQNQNGLQVLRLFQYNDRKFFDEVTESGESVDYVDVETEISVLERLLEIVSNKLKPFKTTIKKDERRLKKKDVSKNERHALYVRIGEMKVLEYYKSFAEECKKLLEMKESKLIKLGILSNENGETQKLEEKYEPYSEYIEKTITPLMKLHIKEEKTGSKTEKKDDESDLGQFNMK